MNTTEKLEINKQVSVLVPFLLVGIVFLQNPPWFFWDNGFIYSSILVLVLTSICFLRFKKNTIKLTDNLILIFVLVCFFVFYTLFFSKIRLSSIVTLLTFISLLFISELEKILTLKYLTSSLGTIVLISLIAWIISNYFYELPLFGYITYGEGKGDNGTTVISNHFLFVQESSGFINRFYSVFDEPGVLGTLSAFVLFANKYNFKNWYNVFILAGAIFTFSLAFILLTFLGLFFLNIKKGFKILKGLSIFLFLIFILVQFFNDNPAFQTAVIDRIFNFSDSGVESRTSYGLNVFFESYIFSIESILGKGSLFFENHSYLLSGQGYKLFIIEFGIFGFLLVLSIYLVLMDVIFLNGLFFLILFIFSFLQRPFLFTSWQLIVFAVGISNLYYLKNKNNND
jgi:hypothetical protein